jgi:phosphate starvation-inducible protein PhoH
MDLTLTLRDDLTDKQRTILKSRSDFLLLIGPGGTSKTYLALARGLRAITKKQVGKIVIIRSAVETRKIGFLPGDHAEKLDVYTDPYVSLISELSPKKNYKALESAKVIEFCSTSFLRGVTFKDSYVIVDEYQNMDEHELDTIMTRVGEGTQLTLCGDTAQTDLLHAEGREHLNVIKIITSMDEFETYEFGIEDIVRSPFVKSYYEAKQRIQLPGFLTGDHRN